MFVAEDDVTSQFPITGFMPTLCHAFPPWCIMPLELWVQKNLFIVQLATDIEFYLHKRKAIVTMYIFNSENVIIFNIVITMKIKL